MAKKKEKITYIDDGRTLADMSGVPGSRLNRRHSAGPRASFKEVWATYWGGSADDVSANAGVHRWHLSVVYHFVCAIRVKHIT